MIFLSVCSHGVAPGGGSSHGVLAEGDGVRPAEVAIFRHVVDDGKPVTDHFENVNHLVMFFVTFGGRGLCHCPSGSGILPELLLLGCWRTGGYGDSPASS